MPLHGEIKKAKWLIGEWKCVTTKRVLHEVWWVKNDSCLAERSYFLKNADTVQLETVNLEEHQGKLFYIPTLKDENNGKPVLFKQTSATQNQLVFENLEHDFPQKITYTRITADSLLAETSGIVNGQFRNVQFPMKKIK